MQTTRSRRSSRRPRAALAAVAIMAATVAILTMVPSAAAESDISHRGRYSNGSYSTWLRDTRMTIAAGWDDPAGSGVEKSIAVTVTQRWCKGTTLITRDLSGDGSNYAGKVNPKFRYSTVAAGITLKGTETRTPAGRDCATPDATATRSREMSIAAFVFSDVRGQGEVLSYDRGDGGSYTYQDASSSAALVLNEWNGWFGFQSSTPGDTWLWEGFWADARGVDPAAFVPAL